MNARTVVALSVAIALGLSLGISAVTFLGGQLGVAKFSVVQTTTSKDRFFEVIGTSEISTAPDKAEATLGISVIQPTAKQAQDRANAVMQQLIAELKALNFTDADMKTQNYSISPNYDYNSPAGGSPKISGYRAEVSLRARTSDFDRINDAIDAASRVGVNNIGQVAFIVSDEKQKELATEGRRKAIEQAKKNAQELAEFSGMRLGRVVNVSESAGGQPETYAARVMSLSLASADAPKTELQAGSSTLRYAVTISYETQ